MAGYCSSHSAHKLVLEVHAGAHANTLAFHLVVSLIVEVAKAERAGIQPVLVGSGHAANDGTVQPGMAVHRDVKAAAAGVEARLFLHAVEVTVQLLFADVKGGTAARAAKGEAATETAPGLQGTI